MTSEEYLGQFTQENQNAMQQAKRMAPYRIVWGMIDKVTREFSCYASFDKRQANKAVRQGHFVVIAE